MSAAVARLAGGGSSGKLARSYAPSGRLAVGMGSSGKWSTIIGVTLALAAPGAAHAATVTTDKACYKAGEAGTVSVAGFIPGSTVDATVDGQPMVNLLPDGSGVGSAPFTPLAAPDKGEATETLTATGALNTAITAQVTYRVTATEVKMSRRSAKLSAKVTWRLSGFGGGNAYLHVARRNAKGKTVTVRTLKLGALTGPCGALTARTPQLPLARPKPGTTYVLRFNTRRASTAAAFVQRTVRTPSARKTKKKARTRGVSLG